MAKVNRSRNKNFRSVSKATYLRQILVRLDTEYIKILEMVNKHNLTHKRGIGFWSLIRIIFPVIETVSYVMGKQKEEFLHDELNVPYGYLVWNLYRNSLMHRDELRDAVYKGKTISWAVHLGNENIGHLIAKGTKSHPTTIHIDIPKLYSSLHEYLVKEINKKDTTKVSIQVAVDFTKSKAKLMEELEDLFNNY